MAVMVFRLEPSGLRMGTLALIGGCSVLGACGPSFEVLAEGDLRFVHCDRLDLDPKIAPSHRLHCWREWRRAYTYGQTRDRVEYAQRRIAEVVSGDTESPFQLPSGEAPGGGRHWVRPGLKVDATAVGPAAAASTAPAAVTPAASVAAAVSAALPGTAVPPPPPAPPTPEELACRSRCEAATAACSPGCETRPTGCKPCDQPLDACLGDCKPGAP